MTSAACDSMTERRPVHVGFLDGIRGLAALYVLLEHVQLGGLDLIGARTATNPTALQQFARFLNSSVLGFGHLAVDVFIVLSGYCLMLPVAQSPDGSLRGGLRGFVKRRARRILPPYYAALIFAIVVTVIVHRSMYPAGQVISHLLLVHNFMPQWLFGINAPFWSIAVEWQIYFVFALILLPLWRRAGAAGALAIALVISLAPLYLLPAGVNMEWSCPWYIALFAFGMASASVARGNGPEARMGTALPWGSLCVAFALLTGAVFFCQRSGWAGEQWGRWFRMEHRSVSWPLDVALGLCVSCGLVSLSSSLQTGSGRMNQRVIRLLESAPVSQLGAFSYSLYLIHLPVVTLWAVALGALSLPAGVAYVGMYAIGVPLGIAGGYLFYLMVERHCLGSKPAARVATVAATPLVDSDMLVPAAP